MKAILVNILTSGQTFSVEEHILKNKYKYLNIMHLFAFLFVPPSIIVGYFLEGSKLTLIYAVTFSLLLFSFFALRRGKKYYRLAVWFYIATPVIMITFALFLAKNDYTRVILPLFPLVVTYFFLGKRAGMAMAVYAFGLIVVSHFVDIGLHPKDWISTVLLIVMIIFIFTFYDNMHEEDKALLSQTNEALRVLTMTDKLTQVKNRHGLDKALSDEILRFERSNRPFGIIMVDIDLFKEVNDRYGHQVGDLTLKEVADILKDSIRATDIAGRWGGEEFLIICPETDLEGVLTLAESIRTKVASHTFDCITAKTVSLGVDVVQKGDKCQPLIKRVDDFLYKAKEGGRNKVCSSLSFAHAG